MQQSSDPAGRADFELTTLYAEHYPPLVRVAVLLLRDQDSAEDAVQDAFCELYRRWGGLRDQGAALAYLRASVLNRCRSQLRHRGVVRRHRWPDAGTAESAEAEVLRAARRERVLDALGRLPRRQREVLVLRHYLGLSEAEIAATLGISAGSVKTHASRGAAALRTLLEEHR